nr:alpha/beta hydrolase [Fusobacterium nucleatum]
MNYRIALIHGFFRNYKDMEDLENNLMNMGYTVDNLNFPLTFPPIERAIDILKEYLLSLKEKGINKQNEIVLIGFGFGGVLIRETLKLEEVKGIVDKIILLSSPINDSTLHRRLKRTFPFIDLIFKPLAIYAKTRRDRRRFDKDIEVGLIIGRESSGFFGKWLGEYNDGYIEMKDVNFPDAKDKILIPITHNELNKRIGTARYINNFIAKGKFRLE